MTKLKLRPVTDGSLKVGDVIMTKTNRWYINSICKLFGVELPHVAVCIRQGIICDITMDKGVQEHDADEYLAENVYDIYRPMNDNIFANSVSELHETQSYHVDEVSIRYDIWGCKYSRLGLIANLIKMMTGKTIEYSGFTYTNYAEDLLWRLGFEFDADNMTPLDFVDAQVNVRR